MESISRHFHILNDLRGIENRQLQPKSTSMLGLNSRLGSGFKISPETSMLE